MMVVPRGLSIFFDRKAKVVRFDRRAVANANANEADDDDGTDRRKILLREDKDCGCDDPATQSVVARMTIATTSKNKVDTGIVG
jgi:hypothetical protein